MLCVCCLESDEHTPAVVQEIATRDPLCETCEEIAADHDPPEAPGWEIPPVVVVAWSVVPPWGPTDPVTSLR